MTRTFESGPAVLPDGPLADPPEIPERQPSPPSPRPTESPLPDPVQLVSDKQITVSQLVSMLLGALDADPSIGDYLVESEGCDCVGPAVGVKIDQHSREVLVVRGGE